MPNTTPMLEDLHHLIARVDALAHAVQNEFEAHIDPDPLDRNRLAHLIGAAADTAMHAVGMSAELLGFPSDVSPERGTTPVHLEIVPPARK